MRDTPSLGSRLTPRILALLLFGLTIPAHGNALRVTFNGQAPSNVVSRGVLIRFDFLNENVDDGSSQASPGIGTGIGIYVNGARADANAGQFTSVGCSVDQSFPWAWACRNLSSTGSTQSYSFTWQTPRPGTSTIEFQGLCQEIPVPSTGTRFCRVNNRPWGSIVVTVSTVVQNAPPNGLIDSPETSVTIYTGDTVAFFGSGSDPEQDLPLSYLWDFSGGATNSTLEDPGAVTFGSPGSFLVTFKVTESFGTADSTPDTRTVTVLSDEPGSLQFSQSSFAVAEDVGGP
ncbi:MAG TPA: PKD domain-containing protein, partial [Candidatus Polarisedimenticolia bacterium]|nr:PKD domain-containing protein [Candidatus Polarisedimenticolia bacterium]